MEFSVMHPSSSNRPWVAQWWSFALPFLSVTSCCLVISSAALCLLVFSCSSLLVNNLPLPHRASPGFPLNVVLLRGHPLGCSCPGMSHPWLLSFRGAHSCSSELYVTPRAYWCHWPLWLLPLAYRHASRASACYLGGLLF